MAQSTCKMLARLGDHDRSTEIDNKKPDFPSIPQLKPSSSPEFDQVLANILGATADKKYTPMD